MGAGPILEVLDVRKRFGDLHAVAGVSFAVSPGEIFGFLGPNGAGKTTTLRMILGITRPDAGAVRYEGRDALDRSRTGYLPEERGLFEDMPVLDTLAYLGTLRGMPLGAARDAARRWLARLGLETRARDKTNTLSKGNQQKVQFAGAVLHGPALAVLDEPFSGLDPLNQDLFLELMRALRGQGTAVLVSAHQLDLVERLADRFLLISKGRALLSGTLADMRRAAAGGMDEILALDLEPAGGRTPEAVAEAVTRVAPGVRPEVRPTADGAVRVEVLLPHGADLAPLLAALAPLGAVRRVESRALPLHEIYVRAVRADQGEDAARAEAARV